MMSVAWAGTLNGAYTAMAAPDHSSLFGPLLQQHRLAAALSQEELGERAGLSRRGISDLERGMRRPLPSTSRSLADALELDGQARVDFISAAQWRPRTPVRSARAASNLPLALSSFVGRGRELEQIRTMLQTARLLTLTGTGGVGKTRLATELARELLAESGQRVCLVELAAITESSAVPRATAAALGVPEHAARSPIEALTNALRGARLLLILDNCEQVLQGCAELAEVVLGACPRVRVLATSRERLGVVGETTWRVPSLDLPSERLSVEELTAYDAARLFVERATALVPDFAVSEQNAPAVARLLNRLDGIPLAIELAAAWLPALSVQLVADRLDDAHRLLVLGSRTAPPRQQTLRATVAWSYALLDRAEQHLFDRLSVFAGGWTIEAAEQVCADPENTGAVVRIHDNDVVQLLARLVTKSLVIAAPDETGVLRYRMLETLRQYGRERLVECGGLYDMNDRHSNFFLVWARRKMPPSDTLFPLHETQVEQDNLRAALRWLIDERETNRALQLGAALRWYWFRQGQLSEGYEWCSEILALASSHPDTEELGHVLSASALLAGRQATSADAERLHERAIVVWRGLGNHLELARSLSQLGYLYRNAGRSADAYRCFEEGARLSEEPRSRQMEALNRRGLAETMYDEERYAEALAQAGSALELQEVSGNRVARVWVKRAIGLMHYQRGERAAARRFLEDSLKEARGVEGRGWWLADALACVAQLDVEARRFDRAGLLLREALELSLTLGDRRMIARCIERLAYLAATQGRSARALRLAAAADALRAADGWLQSAVESKTFERWLAPAERGLQPAVRERVRREGARMALERVLAYALDEGPADEAEVPAESSGQYEQAGPEYEVVSGLANPLSPRESEIALLVARGMSNPRIASELIIGERTVQTHVSNILAKLGLSSRVQIAGWVAERYGLAAARHDP